MDDFAKKWLRNPTVGKLVAAFVCIVKLLIVLLSAKFFAGGFTYLRLPSVFRLSQLQSECYA